MKGGVIGGGVGGLGRFVRGVGVCTVIKRRVVPALP